MRLTVIGTGYLGLVGGAGFSDFGNDVTCVDVDEAKIARLLAGETPIYEPGLDALIAGNVKNGRLKFSSDMPGAVAGAEVVFIAVGTPSGADGGAIGSMESSSVLCGAGGPFRPCLRWNLWNRKG